MCRFLLVKSTKPIRPKELLSKFSLMAEISKAPDGDWQGDGWGIAWKQENVWQRKAFLSPIWESKDKFCNLPLTNCFSVHARSASFKKDKGLVDYNQPYINDHYSFTFNGLLEGIAFPRPLAGSIGAQKIWSLFQQNCLINQKQALNLTIKELNQYSKKVKALNLGLSDGERLFAYCQFSDFSDYYTLKIHQTQAQSIVCSEALEGLDFSPLKLEKIHVIT
jgi:predicted glutamine amidotransferase